MPVIGPIQGSEVVERDIKSGADQLVYLVTLSTGNLDPLHEPGLPALGSATHPFDPTLRADKYQIGQWTRPGAECYVTVFYSSNGRFKLPPRNNDGEPGFKAWESTTSTRVISIPRCVKEQLVKGCTGTTGAQTPKYAWTRQDFKAHLPVERIERRLNWPSYKLSERLYIKSQIGKFHLMDPLSPQSVNNPYFRFLGADVRQTTPIQFEYVYRWETEAGNGPPQLSDWPANLRDNIILPTEYREPFWEWQVFPPDLTGVDVCNVAAVNALKPTIKVVPTFDTRLWGPGGAGDVYPQGAVNLPGNPLSD